MSLLAVVPTSVPGLSFVTGAQTSGYLRVLNNNLVTSTDVVDLMLPRSMSLDNVIMFDRLHLRPEGPNMMSVHRSAAAKSPRKQRRRPEPVTTIARAPKIAMEYAQLVAPCPARIKTQVDGSILIVNNCRCHG